MSLHLDAEPVQPHREGLGQPRPALPKTLGRLLTETGDRPLVGMWLCSGSSVMAEIAAGSLFVHTGYKR